MHKKWAVHGIPDSTRERLMDLVQHERKKFVEASVRVKHCTKNVKKSHAFRFHDVHSYNYNLIQKKYEINGMLNASLIEHDRDIIAMEYPTDVCLDSTSELVNNTDTNIIISLIGERYHWESDYMRDNYTKTRVYTPNELISTLKSDINDIGNGVHTIQHMEDADDRVDSAYDSNPSTRNNAESKHKTDSVLASMMKYDVNSIITEQNSNFTIEVHTRHGSAQTEDVQTVYRINCKCWQDKTPPTENTLKALDILYHVCIYITEAQNSEKQPVIVHCLAGVGRTGVFVFYHMMRCAILLGSVTRENISEVFVDLFLYLRSKRTWMVQSLRQMDFLYSVFIARDAKYETGIYYRTD